MDDLAPDLDALACRLAISEAAGSTLVLGVPPAELLLAASAGSSSISLLGESPDIGEAASLLEARSPVAVTTGAVEEPGEIHGNLLVWALDEEDPTGELERALASVADGGGVTLCLEPRRGRDHLVRNLARASCGYALEEGTCGGRLLLQGVRRGQAPATGHELAGLLPLSVVLVTPGLAPGLELLLCDVLLRQHLPPADLFVMDHGGRHAVPENLFGLAERAATRCVLVSRPGETAAASVNEALGGVAASMVSLLTPDVRLAPQHLTWLGLELEQHEDWLAVAADAVARDGCTRRTADWEAGLGMRADPGADKMIHPGQVVLRTEGLLRLGGMADAAGADAWRALWRRLAGAGPLGTVPVPLVMTRA